MRLFLMALPVICSVQASAVFASGSTDALFAALQLPRMLTILQTEAVESGVELAVGLSDRDLAANGWGETVAQINNPDIVGPQMQKDFTEALAPEDLPAILAFWQSPEGQEIVALELSAREALLDPDVEELVMDRFGGIAGDGSTRAEQLQRFIEVNDLVESNVLGAMNANAAFLRGLRNGAPSRDLAPASDSGILLEVWSQEPEIRLATVSWLYGYLSLAYQPLSDADLDAYIGFSASEAGQAFNAALFVAFDRMFVSTSRETGLALARYLTSEDI